MIILTQSRRDTVNNIRAIQEICVKNNMMWAFFMKRNCYTVHDEETYSELRTD